MNKTDDPTPEASDVGFEHVEMPGEVLSLDLDRLSSAALDSPVVKLTNLILVQAIKERADDVLIEPLSDAVRLRFRIDGALVEKTEPPRSLLIQLISRIKIMSNLDIAERRLPQDGAFQCKYNGVSYDFRVSLIPTAYGERCVLRLIAKANTVSKLEDIGMEADTLRRFRKAAHAPSGLILVAGPTGSGKTTTLYSALAELNTPELAIISVEDPIEIQIRGVSQVPVRKEIGLSFANALRSIKRQAPDVIMIGEIRDSETAEIAVEAALTGRRVFCAMHCNDAAGAIARLDDMGIAPFLIASSVTLACAQRLIRKICPHCKERVDYPPAGFSGVNLTPDFFAGATLFRGRGCGRCNQTGYLGRAAIVEALTVNEEMRKLIVTRASSIEIKNLALDEGMKTLQEAAMMKVLEGITSLEQAVAATSVDAPGIS